MRKLIYVKILSTILMIATSKNQVMAQSKTETLIEKQDNPSIFYKTIEIKGQVIFYREAGRLDKPVILFLHGFPSSSRMWQPLLEKLAMDYHVIAPDYIGFGHSSQPGPESFTYTFDNLAEYIGKFITQLSLEKFILVQQDYGGPIGMRIAEKYPEKVQAIIIQNAVSHKEGLSPLWETRKAFWADKEKYYEAVKKNFISLEATRQRHIGSTPAPERINPDTYIDEYLFLNKPGMADIQLNLFYDYQSNVKSYPKWQEWLKKHQPEMLVIWGKYDPSFTVAGAWKYKDDVPKAEVHIVDGGHFALDEAEPEILRLMQQFLKRVTIER
ncbi:pimeloyl-ACP methyl ester carboxylesterase [Pedobacter cryoconitis]|uniref:Pimeloyl-ACP methyl ester carboxylesterase n=1 Tax=Pedobacter cryoconitis TaxID=188932 RepID=A0A7W8ZN34_9SPHI|nr:alpha/beta hydrolase [Pedobacter cryoconitis]MBB5637054.1 pimeloyl-ACP methyl ester carboxylesterase [Pedobacter cryoconitis]